MAQVGTSEVRRWVASVAYKPSWQFGIEEAEEGAVLSAKCKVPNSRRPDSESTILGLVLLNEDVLSDEEQFRLKVRDLVQHMEIHEVGEWLLFDGERVFDPHLDPAEPG